MQQNYLRKKSVLPVDCPEEKWLLQDGDCVDELVADNCHPLHSLLNPPKPSCPDDICNVSTEILEKLCLIEEQDNDTINAFNGSITLLGKCTPEGLPILVCKITNEETGESTYQNHAPTGENGVLESYAGECVECNKQYNFTQTFVADQLSPYCGLPIFECKGELFVLFDGAHIPLPEDTNMLEVTTTNPANTALQCEPLDVQISITDPLEGTAADLIALAVAKGLTYPTFGDPVAEEALAITGCSTGGPIQYGGKTGDTIKDTEGVSASTAFDFTDPACLPVNLNVCFRKCVSAAEAKALAAVKG